MGSAMLLTEEIQFSKLFEYIKVFSLAFDLAVQYIVPDCIASPIVSVDFEREVNILQATPIHRQAH